MIIKIKIQHTPFIKLAVHGIKYTIYTSLPSFPFSPNAHSPRHPPHSLTHVTSIHHPVPSHPFPPFSAPFAVSAAASLSLLLTCPLAHLPIFCAICPKRKAYLSLLYTEIFSKAKIKMKTIAAALCTLGV